MAKASGTQVFYRVVKAQPGHHFAGLYAVEKVYLKNDSIYKKEVVHEWDMRIISEAILAKLGGDAAFSAYKEDHDVEDLTDPDTIEAKARTAADLKDLNAAKLAKELGA
jgi:hypothetical protein